VKTNKFLKSFVSVIVMCIFSAYGCGGYRPHLSRPGNAEDFENYLNSTVAFVSIENTEMYGPYCTGFYISPRRLATAGHCVIPQEVEQSAIQRPVVGREILFLDYSSDMAWRTMTAMQRIRLHVPHYIHSHVVGIDERNDIAIIELNEDEPDSEHWLQLRDISAEPILVGERVYSISNPTSTSWMFMEGLVSRVQIYESGDPIENHMRILHQVRIGPGSSGSELLDEDGRVIGVNVSITIDGAFISLAVPVSYLQLLLQRIDSGE